MELHFKYLQQVREADDAIRREKRKQATTDSDEEEADIYLHRLDAGLFTLQLVDYVIIELCLCGEALVRGRILTVMGHRGESMDTVKGVLEEYMEQMGEATERVVQERQRLRSMIDEL